MDPFSLVTFIQSTMGVITSTFGNLMDSVNSFISTGFFFQIIMIIIIIGKCIFLALTFGIKAFMFFFTGFIPWLFTPWPKDYFNPKKNDETVAVGLIPYVIRYIIVIAISVMNIPKCILWYALDTLGWIVYLPFRCAFWLIDYIFDMGITKMEHKAWNFLDEIDYFLHGPVGNWFIYHYADIPDPNIPDPNSLNLGFHFIHFPNSVMETCFSISPYSLANCKGAKDVLNAFNAFMSCAMSPF
jgi:hypothetical protein